MSSDKAQGPIYDLGPLSLQLLLLLFIIIIIISLSKFVTYLGVLVDTYKDFFLM